jgi:hypothetical protein
LDHSNNMWWSVQVVKLLIMRSSPASHQLHPLITTNIWEWSASRPGHLIPWKRAFGTHWIIGCVGPRSGLDEVAKRKKFLSLLEVEPQSSITWVAILIELSRLFITKIVLLLLISYTEWYQSSKIIYAKIHTYKIFSWMILFVFWISHNESRYLSKAL